RRRADLHDPIVLDVQRQRAADAAECTDRVGLRLPGLVPLARFAQLVLRAGHQGAGWTDGDAVAAVHARGLGQLLGVLGRDVGVEAAAGDRDCERVLVLVAAGVD